MTDQAITFTVTAASTDTVLAAAVLATAAGEFSAALAIPSLTALAARLNPENVAGTDYPDRVNGAASWIWASKGVWDETTQKAFFSASSAGQLDNGYASTLNGYNAGTNVLTVYEDPCGSLNATWPRSFAHGYDNFCKAGRTLYKMTAPRFVSGLGNVQPNVVTFDIDQITDTVTSAREGGAYLGSIAPPSTSITGGAMEYFAGANSIGHFIRRTVNLMPLTGTTWASSITLPFTGMTVDGTLGWPYHNLLSANPNSGLVLAGGGSYNSGGTNFRYNLEWVTINATTLVVTELDDSPVIMSTNEADMPASLAAHLINGKSALCSSPTTVEWYSFHDNGNLYAINPYRPAGYQWRVVRALPFEVDFAIPIWDHGCVLLFTGGAGGTATAHIYMPQDADDYSPPSVPTGVSATATSSNSITVTWSASTDPTVTGDTTSGLAGYKVYRGGVLVATLGDVLTYTDTGLSASTAYSYTVSAYDVAGNESEVSAAGSATTDSSTVVPLFYDDFNYVVERNPAQLPYLTGGSNFIQTGGWLQPEKAVNLTGAYQGYLYTEYVAARGKRCFVSEVPNASNQTDHYVNYNAPGAMPANIWFRFRMYTDPASDFSARIGSPETWGSKFIYSSPDGSYPVAGGVQLWMIGISRTTATNLPAGDPVAPANGSFYIDCAGRADGTEAFYSGTTSLSHVLGHNVTRTYFPGGTWLDIKLHFDMSGAQGVFEMWGKTTGSSTWTKYSEWIGGVTPQFVWPLQPSRRIGNAAIRTPSDFGRGSNPPNSTPYTKFYWDEFGMYSSDPG